MSLTERLGSLSKDGRKKEEKEEDDRADGHSEDYTLTKSIIIQKDEKGYGLTVSGDNPVFVQSVKEGGAAARAGVHKGDRIVKVNGKLVTSYNHKEVVKLIKSSPYVALTLLGRSSGHQVSPPSSSSGGAPLQSSSMAVSSPDPTSPGANVPGTPGPGSEKTISGPVAVNPQVDKELKMQKTSMIRLMYEKECDECERLTEEIRQGHGTPAIQQKLEEKLRVRERLGDQLYQLTGIPTESHSLPIINPRSPPSGLPPPGGTFSSSSASQRAAARRHEEELMRRLGPDGVRHSGSGDGLQHITEDGGTRASDDMESTTTGTPPRGLPPKHAKTKSMPEAFYNADLPPSGKNVTVSRSNSDSRRRPQHQQQQQQQQAMDTSATDSRDGASEDLDRSRTSSLQGSADESSADTLTHQNSAFSSPGTLSTEPWDEVSEQTVEGLNTSRLSGSGVSPPRELRPPLHAVSPLQADVIPMEEEEEVSMEDEQLEDHGPFSDLNRLKHKPAHLAVFLYYLVSNSDPSPLLFYLVTEQYTQGSMKDLRRWAYEIYSTFLIPSAVIKVEDLDSSLLDNIEQTLIYKSDKEDIMRTVFQNVRHITQKQISELLADFRQKRTLGLANLYGDNELSDHMDRATELKIVENKLLPHLEKCTREDSTPRDKAMAWALATIMKQLGLSPTKANVLERCQSFISKDKRPFKFSRGSSKKNGHQFNPTNYHSTVTCHHCKRVLWGIGYQGFQCTNCDINVHKSCMEQVQEICSGRRKKEKRTSMLNMLRKTTNPNPAAIKEAQRLHDDSHPPLSGLTGPVGGVSGLITPPSIHSSETSSAGLFPIRPDEDEELHESNARPKTLVEQYTQLQGINDAQSPATPPRNQSPETMETDDHKRKPSTTALGRSESLNKRRESRKNVRRSRSDVQVDDQTLKSLNQSGSSSNSSLSNRSLDSPSASAEALPTDSHHPSLSVLQEDSDFETEPDLPSLDSVIPKDQLKKLKKQEKKRQEVINELFYTERVHVKDLKVIDKIFRIPMTCSSHLNDSELVNNLFTGLEDLVDVHSKLNNRFKNTRKESCVVGKVADLLLSSFDGEAGEEFKKSAAAFCCNQKYALDYLRAKQRKDEKLATFIREASSNPLCRRLELKDIIPKAMQRLTKYPLLIDNLLKETPKNSEDHALLQKASSCSREILNYVNQAVRDRENKNKLADMQKRLEKRGQDNSAYQSFDLREYKLIYDGSLTWRISKQKLINLHVVLLDEVVVLLQKQDDRLILKAQSTGKTVDDNNKSTHSPIIKLSKLMVRQVATDKRAIFLINNDDIGPQIYELVSSSVDGIKRWFKYLSEGSSEYSRRKGKGSEGPGSFPSRPVSMVAPDTSSRHLGSDADTTAVGSDAEDKPARGSPSLRVKAKSQSLDNLVEVHKVTDTELTQPSEVVANTIKVNLAEPALPPAERLSALEQVIMNTLEEKRAVIAETLGIPTQDFQHISEMASELGGSKDPRELILSALHHSDQLTCLINSCLNNSSLGGATGTTQNSSPDGVDVANNNSVRETRSSDSEERTFANHNTSEGVDLSSVSSSDGADTGVGGSVGPGSQLMTGSTHSWSSGTHSDNLYVSLPSGQLLDITAKINSQLNHLMEALSLREKEQDRLQQELNEARGRLDQLLTATVTRNNSGVTPASRPDSYISVTSSASEADHDAAVTMEEVSVNQVVLQESSGVVPNSSSLSDDDERTGVSSESRTLLSVEENADEDAETERVEADEDQNEDSGDNLRVAQTTIVLSSAKQDASEGDSAQETSVIEGVTEDDRKSAQDNQETVEGSQADNGDQQEDTTAAPTPQNGGTGTSDAGDEDDAFEDAQDNNENSEDSEVCQTADDATPSASPHDDSSPTQEDNSQSESPAE